MQPPVYPPQLPHRRRFDLSIVVLLIVGTLVVWGIVQAARSIRNAELGLISYERAQRDLLIDTGLINDARGVRVDVPLTMRLRKHTVMVVSRINAHRSAVGSGVILRDDAHGMVILTAKHMVRHAGPVSVVLSNHDSANSSRIGLALTAGGSSASLYGGFGCKVESRPLCLARSAGSRALCRHGSSRQT